MIKILSKKCSYKLYLWTDKVDSNVYIESLSYEIGGHSRNQIVSKQGEGWHGCHEIHVQFAFFYNITFLSLQSIMVLAKEEAWCNTLFSSFFCPWFLNHQLMELWREACCIIRALLICSENCSVISKQTPVLIVLLSETERWLPPNTWLLNGEF